MSSADYIAYAELYETKHYGYYAHQSYHLPVRISCSDDVVKGLAQYDSQRESPNIKCSPFDFADGMVYFGQGDL